jgi:hypothetical protein
MGAYPGNEYKKLFPLFIPQELRPNTLHSVLPLAPLRLKTSASSL